MSTPLFFPTPRILARVRARGARPLRDLMADAEVPCRATGRWTERLVYIVPGRDGLVEKEPGDWGAVRLGVPAGLSARDAARHAIAVMAYGVMDLVARESIRGLAWARPRPPRGRPASGTAKTSRERQRAHRARLHRVRLHRGRVHRAA